MTLLLVFSILFLLFGIILFFMGLAEEDGVAFCISLILLVPGGLGSYKAITTMNHRAHVHALRDLRSEGWDITNQQLHGSGSLDFGCVKLDVNKVDGKFKVTKDRAESDGGGYIVIKPVDGKKLQEVCP